MRALDVRAWQPNGLGRDHEGEGGGPRGWD